MAVCASVFVCADECVLYGALLLIIIVQASPRASCQPLSVRHHRLCVCSLSPCSVPFSGSRGISPAPATLSILAQVELEPSVCRARRSLHNPVIPVLAARWQQALQNRRAGGEMGSLGWRWVPRNRAQCWRPEQDVSGLQFLGIVQILTVYMIKRICSPLHCQHSAQYAGSKPSVLADLELLFTYDPQP